MVSRCVWSLMVLSGSFALGTPPAAQTHAELAAGLTSSALERRADAIHRLSAMAAEEQAAALQSAGVQEALKALLEAENAATDALYLDGRGTSAVYGESYSDYYSEILDLALLTLEVMDLGDDARKARLLTALVRGTYNPDSPFVHTLAGYGRSCRGRSRRSHARRHRAKANQRIRGPRGGSGPR